MSGTKVSIDFSTYPSEFEDKIKWMIENIPGTRESIEKYGTSNTKPLL